MGSVVVGVIGTLLGVLIGGGLQIWQAKRSHKWQQEDSSRNRQRQQEDLLSDTKRGVYSEYLRSISASYAVATSRSASPSEEAKSRSASAAEEAKLRAATAGIVLLSEEAVSGPASDLTDTVIELHGQIAAGVAKEEAKRQVEKVNYDRLKVIDLFKADLGLGDRRG